MEFKSHRKRFLVAAAVSILFSQSANAQTDGSYDDRGTGFRYGDMGEPDRGGDWNAGRGGAGGTGADIYASSTPTAKAGGMRQPDTGGSMGGGAAGGGGMMGAPDESQGSMGGGTGGGRGSTGTGTGSAGGGM